MSVIAEAFEVALAGEGTVVLIEGPAGIGKTSLLEAAVREAERLGARPMTARPFPLDREVAWNVVRQLFASTLHDGSPEADPRFAGAARLALPALGLVNTDDGGVDPFSPLHGLYWLAANVAAEGPILIALDDLQWADLSSIRFISHLASRCQGLPIVVIAALRTGELTGDSSVALATLATQDSVRTLQPLPLTPSGTSEVLRRGLGAGARSQLTDACYEMTGGNPFLLVELVRELARAGAEVSPEQVRALTPRAVSRGVLVRLARLPPAALALARAVAVLGGAAGLHLAAELAELPAEKAVQTAEALIEANVLVTDGDELKFAHPLVREAVYGDISKPARWQLHARAARVLAAAGAQDSEVAAHLLAVAPSSDQWTVQVLLAAASTSRDQGAPLVAAGYLSRALAEPPLREQRAQLLMELGALETDYDPAAASVLAEAQRLSEGTDTRALIAALHARALSRAGEYRAAAEVVGAAADEVFTIDQRLCSALTALRFAACRWDPASQKTCRQLFATLRARAERGEPLEGLEHINLATELTAIGEDRAAVIRHTREGIASPPTLPPMLAQTTPVLAVMLVFADQSEEAKVLIERSVQQAQDRGSPLDSAIALAPAAFAALYRGDITAAVAFARGALDLTGGTAWSQLALVTLIDALVERAEPELAMRELADRGLDSDLTAGWSETMLRYRRARVHAALHDHHHAVDELLAVGELTDTWNAPNPAQIPWRSTAARSLHTLGCHEEAQQLADQELQLARRWGAARTIGVAQCAAGLCDPTPRGLQLSRDAVATLQDAPAQLELARALTDLGARLRRERQPTQAQPFLRQALDLAHRSGGRAIAQRAHDELLATGAKPRRPAIHGRESLTPRELRVAELAAQGKTNREIAQALYVTARTVEHDLTSTYTKLNIQTRAQLAGALDTQPHPTSEPNHVRLPVA